MNFWQNLKKPIIGLAPMDGVTDVAFRHTQAKISRPDLIYTEFVHTDGLFFNPARVLRPFIYTPIQRPIVAQLYGKNPDHFYIGAHLASFLGFDGLDLNMGCPAKTVVNSGGGAALIDQPDLASYIIKSAQKGLSDFAQNPKIDHLGLKKKNLEAVYRFKEKYRLKTSVHLPLPLSVKTRIGTRKSLVSDWIPHLLSHSLAAITIHGRLLKDGHSGPVAYDQISLAADLRSKGGHDTLILGNGGLSTRFEAEKVCRQYHLDGALIGQSAFGNPWVFSNHSPGRVEKFKAMALHAKTFEKYLPDSPFESLRKHFLWYTKGLKDARSLRQKIITFTSSVDLKKLS
jgi:tRNA-dihydrouridine synthase B